jgi:hypothetical protein
MLVWGEGCARVGGITVAMAANGSDSDEEEQVGGEIGGGGGGVTTSHFEFL